MGCTPLAHVRGAFASLRLWRRAKRGTVVGASGLRLPPAPPSDVHDGKEPDEPSYRRPVQADGPALSWVRHAAQRAIDDIGLNLKIEMGVRARRCERAETCPLRRIADQAPQGSG